MRILQRLLVGILFVGTAVAQTTDVQQNGIFGNAPISSFPIPVGQSFTAGTNSFLYGIALAAVGTNGAADMQISLYRTDATGATIVGSSLTTAMVRAGDIRSDIEQPVTPIWFTANFSQPYAQTVGERLAFTIEGGGDLSLYYSSLAPYAGGRLLGDPSKDLTFATIVPEPSTIALLAGAGILIISVGSRRREKPFQRNR